ncbi:histidinol-phosphate transaminase [Zobellia galactanivorans]|uniref:Histidinol-phosphate aminotransferase n=1 Tax=Zobellia galactanivorans (strain DSM 12802 / CCUG 47099 / CIP 106680 / NCIMB 13871 / Dsij) TaxID=63186 RepID=G0L6L0_ZOBGA|nr:histidinol-phosphate transaminase [Zobellia galactanivorans]MBU3025476.1 histidinol-phosphate aminotransferase family protein [Zobellia galactanivorans]MDO6810307.1 histidinol-phosphate transaminase [Zobellia galactanivorans]CAZ97017.1 Histidinol-phosphate aminotransferase [Zobellia galactanivorans]
MKTLDRRAWLKRGALTAAGAIAAPYLSYGAFGNEPVTIDAQGNLPYTPFFKEYLPYEVDKPVELLAKLNANENPYGPSPMAVDAMQKYAPKGNRYAWKELYTLIDKIAVLEGVEAETIMMGPGSSDLLEKTAMVFFQNGGNIVSADPSYMSLIKVAEATGATWKPIKLKDDWSHDLPAMEAAIDADTKLVYICNPNNPTGSMTDHEELIDFCSRVSEKVPIFVDEAYLGFLDDAAKKSMVSLINEGKNVMIARTFSKIQGMAGLRVGYMVAQPETLAIIQKITRGGMGISLPSVYAAMASMDDIEFSNKTRKLNSECREYVYSVLDGMGYSYVPSSTSFIIFPIEMEGKAFLEKMTAEGVGVRAFSIMDKNWCRVSMGTMEEMKLFTTALQKVLA